TRRRTDVLASPRAGLVLKPREAISFYGSYSTSALPSAGDQFSSLDATTETLAPERFTNHEVGAKWDVHRDIALTVALYRLDRTNTRAADPNVPGRLVQTGAQRSEGIEAGLTGSLTPRWQFSATWASQSARVRRATTSARAGATVPLVPGTSVSAWNRFQLQGRVGIGVGVVHQGETYAAIDNTVTLPAFTRWDGALYLALTRDLRLQANVENVLGTTYFATAHANNNILPGAPRTLRLSMTLAP
ncbi:MAG TPA: TonB-dependent receptor, partial [Gemmatimonadaceae bacterium]|nr:TonB-dependent receptor [Gemmatimonadaceae bacterium]